jgi:hypothetical protein
LESTDHAVGCDRSIVLARHVLSIRAARSRSRDLACGLSMTSTNSLSSVAKRLGRSVAKSAAKSTGKSAGKLASNSAIGSVTQSVANSRVLMCCMFIRTRLTARAGAHDTESDRRRVAVAQ